MFKEFIPKSYIYLTSGYRWSAFKKDLLAGITVGIIAIPLAMAFAIASGVTPDKGLFTAIIAGFLISALGGSRVQIGGPTGAFVVLIYGIVQRTGYEGLVLSTLIASVLLVLFGLFRLGSWIKYVPHPLIMGFTTGIALVIFSSQIKDFFGLQIASLPADFTAKWITYFHAFPTFQWVSLLLGGGTLGLILFMRRFFPTLPWGVTAIAAGTVVAYFFQLPVETIYSKFGQIPSALPLPSFPSFDLFADRGKEIIMDGIAIAFLGAIESLLCAVIADGMTGGRHKSNCELVGQGVANFASIIFGGIPATGAIARTAANVKTGAQTPVAGMIHALTLFCAIFFFAPIVSQIPLPCLAAVLIMVAWNMSEVSHFLRLMKTSASDVAVLLSAFLLTVFVDITVAILFGMILACFLFMQKMSKLSKSVSLTQVLEEKKGEFPEREDHETISDRTIPAGIEIYEIQGPFFFGAADMLRDVLSHIQAPPKVFILRMRHVPLIDASGIYALKEFLEKCKKTNTLLYLSCVQESLKKDLKRGGFIDLIGESNIFSHLDKALKKASL